MGWYTVGVSFRTGMQDSIERSISLIAVASDASSDARVRAEELGRSLAADYEWEFDGVIDVYEVVAEDLRDGVELYSFFADEPLLAAIREQIGQRADVSGGRSD